MEYNIGDIVETKKQHPCGSKQWKIKRVGVSRMWTCSCIRKTKSIEDD